MSINLLGCSPTCGEKCFQICTGEAEVHAGRFMTGGDVYATLLVSRLPDSRPLLMVNTYTALRREELEMLL